MSAVRKAALEEGHVEIAYGLDALVQKLAAKRRDGNLYTSH
jgi:hypothetical protein